MPLPNEGVSHEHKELSRDEIDAIRARHPIEAVVAQYAELRKAGRLLQARCPLPGHEDTGPSFTVYTTTQSFHCFGCNRGGDVFKFLQLVEGLSFRETVARLEGGATATPAKRAVADRGAGAITPAEKAVDEKSLSLLTAAVEVYHTSLLLDDAMLQYLAGRGIAMATIRHFRLGYATGDNLTKYFRFRNWDVQLGKELGLIGEHGEFFRQRITIPEWRCSKAVYLVGRQMRPYQRVKYLGLPGAPKPLYGLEQVQGSREVFIVEGSMDMLTLIQWGYPAVALLGSHLKAEWEKELAFAERIYIVTDSDAPGRASAIKIAEMLREKAIIVPPLPNAKDVNELSMHPGGKETFAQLVRQAREERKTKRERST